jgi:hypothetical protein
MCTLLIIAFEADGTRTGEARGPTTYAAGVIRLICGNARGLSYSHGALCP